MACEVRTPVFNGPFDVLLQLVLRQRVDVYDIEIAAVTDAFTAEMDRMARCDLETATEFLSIAAVLVDLKVRRMLPGQPVADLDEDLEPVSERDRLLARLVEGGTFRAAARALRRLLDEAARSRPRQAGATEERWLDLAPRLLEGVSPADLRAAFLRASATVPPPRVDIDHITPIALTVGDAAAELFDLMSRRRRATFRSLTAGIDDRLELVVRFLAVLELVKEGLVDVEQATTFGDIVISWTASSGTTPASAAVGVDDYDG